MPVAQSVNLFQQADNNQAKFIDGQVAAIFFESPDSFYKVALVKVDDTNTDWQESEIVVTGNFGELVEEADYHFIGKIVDHPKYGTQFQVSNYAKQMATTSAGVVKYLSGDNFPGVGKKTAEKIVDSLGIDALQQINADNKVLDKIGISAKVKATIVSNLDIGNDVDQIIMGLNSYGFGSQLAEKIYQKYHQDALKVIQENPYQLMEDIDGISFKKADAIASELGIEFDSDQRLEAGLLFALTELSLKNGDTYATSEPLLNETLKILNEARPGQISGDKLAAALVELAKTNRVVGQEERIYLSRLFWAEKQIAEHLHRIMANVELTEFKPELLRKKMKTVEKQNGIDYDEFQEEAIAQALKSPIFILTGGPGTGKTTIINGIVHTFANLNDYSLDVNAYKDKPFPIVLAAPTGRAAKHMSESTGLPASTIHRLLGLNGQEDADFSGVKDIDGQLLIIDEMSMVDTDLFKTLLKAVPNHMQVILVGDQDQLPSVGPGQVFHDLISSNTLPKIELERIYRQDEGSSITELAHDIHNGILPADFTENQADRSFIACNENQILSVVKQVVSHAHDKGFELMDTQVLAPMYRGTAGINAINDTIQNVLNPNPQNEVTVKDHLYRIGDKVLQLINSPEENVFNGDLGIITGIEKQKGQTQPTKIVVDFDETQVIYDRINWNQFTLAYCTSIHKAQGSEFKLVILPLVRRYSKMLKRNLLYTAVTRASDFLIMVGDPVAYQMCVENNSVNRKTTLIQRLAEVLEPAESSAIDSKNDGDIASDEVKQPTVLTAELIQTEQIDPMIGMQKVKPNDFMK